MKDATVVSLKSPPFEDPLTEVLRAGASKLLTEAIEAEVALVLEKYRDLKTPSGTQGIVRNGYLPERKVQTGIGGIEVQVPKVRDRTGSGIKFNSSIVPPYIRKSKSIEELIPVLYLKGVSTGDFTEALSALVGEEKASGFSASVVSKLKSKWSHEYQEWIKRDLSAKEYVYWWVDGVYFNVRSEQDKQCIFVIIGADKEGKKELVSLSDGYRESSESWEDILRDVKRRGLINAPKIAVGDGALGFWKALNKHYPKTLHQRCWVHKVRNVLDKLPDSVQSQAKSKLNNISHAPTREEALKSFDDFVLTYKLKYSKATDCLEKDKDELLSFFDFPSENWTHLRTTNVVESVFSTVKLRTRKTRSCVSRTTLLSMVYKLTESAQKRMRRLRGFKELGLLVQGVQFVNGEISQQENAAA